MPGLLLIVSEASGERFAAAVELAGAAAALGRPVAVLLRGPAVRALGHKPVAQAFDTLFELGADVSLCQTAMAAHGLTAADLPPGITTHGMISFLAGREDWQILLA
jgi:intracellular sulfur oxidation DsrE/DsrF family protein